MRRMKIKKTQVAGRNLAAPAQLGFALYSLKLVRAVPVEADANPDAYDGENDAEEDKRSGFTDGFYADEDDDAHDDQEACSIDAQIVVQYIRVLGWVTEKGNLRSHVVLETTTMEIVTWKLILSSLN